MSRDSVALFATACGAPALRSRAPIGKGPLVRGPFVFRRILNELLLVEDGGVVHLLACWIGCIYREGAGLAVR